MQAASKEEYFRHEKSCKPRKPELWTFLVNKQYVSNLSMKFDRSIRYIQYTLKEVYLLEEIIILSHIFIKNSPSL